MRALAFSGGKDSLACLHLMLSTLDCAIYVNTGFAYPETLELVEYARTMLSVHEVVSDRKRQNEREGIPSDVVPINWTRLGQEMTGVKPAMVQSYLGCCFENLALPLFQKAKELGVTELVLGQRLEEGHKSPARDGNIVDGIKRLHPIEDWTTDQVMSYLSTKMEMPAHFHIKHSSLDCYDCTAYKADSADRIRWTRDTHPKFYEEYRTRENAVNEALLVALGCVPDSRTGFGA